MVSWLILSMAGVVSIALFAMIAIGAMTRRDFKSLDKNLYDTKSELREDAKELLQSLKESKEQQDRIINRLQNLETIVTSEAWDAIKDGEDAETIQLLMDEEEEQAPSPEEVAKHIAKKVR